MVFRLFLITLVLVSISAPAAAQSATPPCSRLEVAIRSTLSGSDVRAFEKEFRQALDKVCDWWGKTYTGKISIEVLDSRGPSMALVPAWRGNRGQMIFRSGTISQNITATIHELTHLFAPNGNRFLAEGLAVYAQEALASTAVYPTYGEDIHLAAKPLADASIPYLDEFATPQRLTQEQYVVAGSFVRYLIETHGLNKFREVYAMTPLIPRARDAGDRRRWIEVYGLDIEKLALAWTARILR
jgi:hypothetical protein